MAPSPLNPLMTQPLLTRDLFLSLSRLLLCHYCLSLHQPGVVHSWDWGLKINFGDSDSFNFGGSSFGFDTFLLKNLFLAHYKICSIRQN